MTNSQIIYNAAQAHGFTSEQLDQLLTAYKGDLPFHTLPEWSRRGYHVKGDAKPLFDCYLWKHTNKPSRAAIEAAQDAGDDIPENSPHFYQKRSNIYSFAQVEKNATAPDLEAIKARFCNLPGLTLTVKGEKTGSPNVWFSGDVEKYADDIKAAGGIWSKKKSSYWVKPSAAPTPTPEEGKPAEPVPSMMEDAPAPSDAPEPTPAPVVPGPWKRCSFYTICRSKDEDHLAPHQVDGYTDGIFNYYAVGGKCKLWYAIHTVYGLSAASASSRRDAQARALENIEKVRELESRKDARLQSYADAIRDAQDNEYLPF